MRALNPKGDVGSDAARTSRIAQRDVAVGSAGQSQLSVDGDVRPVKPLRLSLDRRMQFSGW